MPGTSPTAPHLRAGLWLFVAITSAALLFRWVTLFQFDVNWDEFLYLSQVFDAQAGRLSAVLQTFHVHLFVWISQLDGYTLDRIVAARVVMWFLNVATAVMLGCIFRRFMSVIAAGFAVAAYVTFSFVIEHGASFRVDPIATFFLISAALALLYRGIAVSMVAGLGVAMAALVTIKSVFYWPALGVLLAARIHGCRQEGSVPQGWRDAAVAFVTAVIIGGLLLVYHASTLSVASVGGVSNTLSGAFATTLWQQPPFPRLGYLLLAVSENVVFFFTFLVGLNAALRQAFGGRADRQQALTLLALATPMLSLVIYRNAFPYFYVFMLALPAALCGFGVDEMVHRKGGRATFAIVGALAAFLVGQAAATGLANLDRGQETQSTVLRVVHQLFPQPVPYVDRCSMISAYPKVGFFMSTWGLKNYYERKRPVMRENLIDREPVFLLANHLALDLRSRGKHSPLKLLPEDMRTLTANYIHHWGPLYVAGKRLRVRPHRTQTFQILISGDYTLESVDSAVVDGRRLERGEVVPLDQGAHTVSIIDGDQTLVLRWGRRLPVPEIAPPEKPMFTGFVSE